ncbi:hypothetical protein NONI108955_22655 [Nocardia ninae]
MNYCHAHCLFGLTNQFGYAKYQPAQGVVSTTTDWADVLHVGSIHLKDRGRPVQLVGHDGTLKDLNQMPGDFAKGILDVWVDFETELQAQGHAQLHGMAEACRVKAVEDAGNIFDSVMQRAGAYQIASTKKVTKLF